MTATTIPLDLPDDLVALLGPPESVAGMARETVVLELLRQAHITQGQAARLLGITHYDILDLMGLHRIPSGPETAEEMRAEIEAGLRYF